jgi:hypothetical protein
MPLEWMGTTSGTGSLIPPAFSRLSTHAISRDSTGRLHVRPVVGQRAPPLPSLGVGFADDSSHLPDPPACDPPRTAFEELEEELDTHDMLDDESEDEDSMDGVDDAVPPVPLAQKNKGQPKKKSKSVSVRC